MKNPYYIPDRNHGEIAGNQNRIDPRGVGGGFGRMSQGTALTYNYGVPMGYYDSERARRQNHSGKGPKGYRRSDENVFDEVCELLSLSPDVDASEIEVTVKDGEVTLTGQVASRFEKRAAEDVASSARGVKDVMNRLSVPKASGGPQ